jgi:hypothetical protein
MGKKDLSIQGYNLFYLAITAGYVDSALAGTGFALCSTDD